MRKLFAFISALFVLPLAAQDAGAVRQLQKLTQVYRYLDGLYVDEVDMQPLVESAISGMLEELDPHSAYIGADEMKGVQESFEGGVQRHRRRIQHPARHGHRGQYDRRGARPSASGCSPTTVSCA